LGLNEHRFVPNRLGSMSIRRSTKYTVVPLAAASLSIGVSACTKCDTSAMSTEFDQRVSDSFTWAILTNTSFNVSVG
jgi:hypothetical protein